MATMSARPSKQNLDTYTGRLGAAIKARRQRRRMTADEFAAAVPTSLATVYGWESGRKQVPVNLLPAIARALGVSIHTLLPNG